MKPSSPAQLARLLDQLHAVYPNGIPRGLIKVPETPEHAEPADGHPPYLFVAVTSDGALAAAEDELLESIATKGLKLTKDSFSKVVVADGDSAASTLSGGSQVVLIFGGSGPRRFVEREGGGRGLVTFSVKDLLADAAHKKELWRELQKLL
jgi:hypothetical protein